ncbi:protein of unknown function [Candidatus Methylocalor cossyra]|uniref:Uncharacterized protein n=1 Tax=Candidatus Methylocalor cossyra TaxID=3108543 RepID=A0ABP1C4T9_9GAMM
MGFYVTLGKDDAVVEVDGHTVARLRTAKVGRRPRGILMGPGARRLWVA